LKSIEICAPTEGRDDLWVSQADALSCVISHLKNNSHFMRNVIGFHTVISKSNTWLHGSLSSCIKTGYSFIRCEWPFLLIDELCKTHNLNLHINASTGPIPFSIGKFMMGNTYEFDNSDAKKILKIIEEDIIAYNKATSEPKRIGMKINKFFNS